MPPPRKLGKYEIVEELGRGGFATVYKARDPSLNRIVALKMLHPYWSNDLGFAARFQREAQAAAGLNHAHIVPVHEAGEIEGQLYIAMAYLPGRTLRELLETEGALPLERALPILAQVAEALDYAHAQGMVHRDVKPANIVVEERAGKVQATLLDFGLVKAMAGSTVLTAQGTLLGSPEYMAPEQADPERAAGVGPAADCYALGVVAYHMLTGRVPFPGNTPGTLNAHGHKPVPPPRSLRPELPEAIAQALLKMLAKALGDRYPSACAFVEELEQAWRAEDQARQREARLAPLYARLEGAFEGEDWAQVLELGGQIRAVDAGYRDAAERMAHARRGLQRPQPLPMPGALRRAPRWAWGAWAHGYLAPRRPRPEWLNCRALRLPIPPQPCRPMRPQPRQPSPRYCLPRLLRRARYPPQPLRLHRPAHRAQVIHPRPRQAQHQPRLPVPATRPRRRSFPSLRPLLPPLVWGQPAPAPPTAC